MEKLTIPKKRKPTRREIEIEAFETERLRVLEDFEQNIMPKFIEVAAKRFQTTPEKILEFFASEINYGRTIIETAFAHYHSRPFWMEHYFNMWRNGELKKLL